MRAIREAKKARATSQRISMTDSVVSKMIIFFSLSCSGLFSFFLEDFVVCSHFVCVCVLFPRMMREVVVVIVDLVSA